ncbi:hypothetical protein BHE74_00026369 [Ensete ventricosum]|nr:hypothetical protein BHE74_00026369 [Ensete ventricosum]
MRFPNRGQPPAPRPSAGVTDYGQGPYRGGHPRPAHKRQRSTAASKQAAALARVGAHRGHRLGHRQWLQGRHPLQGRRLRAATPVRPPRTATPVVGATASGQDGRQRRATPPPRRGDNDQLEGGKRG